MLENELRVLTRQSQMAMGHLSEEQKVRRTVNWAFEKMKDAALDGRNHALILVIFGEDHSMIAAPEYDRGNVRMPLDCLCGTAALLRDRLVSEGVRLRLACGADQNSYVSYYLIASW